MDNSGSLEGISNTVHEKTGSPMKYLNKDLINPPKSPKKSLKIVAVGSGRYVVKEGTAADKQTAVTGVGDNMLSGLEGMNTHL